MWDPPTTRLDLINIQLNLIHNSVRSHPHLSYISSTKSARSHPELDRIIVLGVWDPPCGKGYLSATVNSNPEKNGVRGGKGVSFFWWLLPTYPHPPQQNYGVKCVESKCQAVPQPKEKSPERMGGALTVHHTVHFSSFWTSLGQKRVKVNYCFLAVVKKEAKIWQETTDKGSERQIVKQYSSLKVDDI